MLCLAAPLVVPGVESACWAAPLREEVLFAAGQGGYHTYRIPALAVTPRGTILAFCEGRKAGRGDSGDIDLVMRRSTDRGATWEPPVVVLDDGPNTIGNPCPVVDQARGRIWLPLTRNLGQDLEAAIKRGTSQGTREVWLVYSDDDGQSWSPPRNITGEAKRPEWRWYATGPGCGIQLSSGRLVVPCDHSTPEGEFRSHVIYSDDGGQSWRIGAALNVQTNECQVVERTDGSLLLNMRSYHGRNRRAIATSDDGGARWSNVELDDALIEPVCQASLIGLGVAVAGGTGRLVFANPASLKREAMTVRLSRDDGASWPVARLIHAGPSAYSALAVAPGGDILLLYERGAAAPYETLTLARFGFDWLVGDAP